MRITYTAAQEELRRELRSYFAELITPEVRSELHQGGEYGDGRTYKAIVRKMGADGWLALGWPVEHGGQGHTMLDQLIFSDEAARAGAPVPFLTLNSVAPTIMRYGTDEQKAHFLPRIAAGELHFSIGYSEPEAGTDLAALRTTADRQGDEFVINGQKMWTSLIAYADYVWLACRTDREARKHKGLSVLAVPTDSPGFSWTPVHTVAGPSTSATYYQDVRVPSSALIGELNGGWPLITNQLNHERVALTSSAPLRLTLDEVRTWAGETRLSDGRRILDQEWVQAHLARVHAGVEVLKLMNWKIAWTAEHQPAPAAASATKIYGTELATEAYRLLMEVLGSSGTVRDGSRGAALHGRVERMHRSSLILTFGGGTNEVQRDIVASVGLGIPLAKR